MSALISQGRRSSLVDILGRASACGRGKGGFGVVFVSNKMSSPFVSPNAQRVSRQNETVNLYSAADSEK